MAKINYDGQMQNIIESLGVATKPRLLLHACCAPCSTACIERLLPHFDLTVYFYNPNMDTKEEYLKRLDEETNYCNLLGIPIIAEEFLSEEFYVGVRGLEKEPEGGKRCEKCFYLRLEKTANKAESLGFDFFATTLTVSPLKNSELLNNIGFEIEKNKKVKWLPTDFKKRNGYKRSLELSNEHKMYRQNYCGCVFSKK